MTIWYYITDLEGISAFIAPYLEELRQKLSVRWKAKHWWHRRHRQR